MTLYQELRAAGKALHQKAMDVTKNLDFNPKRVAKRMTLPTAGHTLLFGGEAEQNAFIDFWYHEYRVNGKSLVESVDPVADGLTPLEAEILEAHRHAQTSLYQPERASPGEHQVRVRDLLDPTRASIDITDINWSESMAGLRTALVVFCRLLTVRGITMTSGFFFTFDAKRLPGLLQAYRQKTKRTPPENLSEQRFAFFYQKHRQFGEEQEFRDVV